MIKRYDPDITGSYGLNSAAMREEPDGDYVKFVDIEAIIAALGECEDYFDQRADADCDQDGFIPNKEMQLLTEVREALAKARP